MAGDVWLAGNVAFYGADRPSVFIDADPVKSPWIKPEALVQRGAVLIWSASDPPPAWLGRFPAAQPQPPIELPYVPSLGHQPARLGMGDPVACAHSVGTVRSADPPARQMLAISCHNPVSHAGYRQTTRGKRTVKYRARTTAAVSGVAVLALLLSGCAQTPLGPTVQVMPGPGKSFDAFNYDQAGCKQFAANTVAGQAQNANTRAVGAAALTTGTRRGTGRGDRRWPRCRHRRGKWGAGSAPPSAPA